MKIVFFVPYIFACCFAIDISSYRLSNEAIPNHYSIKIHPDIENDVFEGDVSIYVRTRKVLQAITLHASDLNITETFINNIECNFFYEHNEKVSLKYENDDIQPGEHYLKIKYTGKLRKMGWGFLKVPQRNDFDKGFIIVTDFEPTAARRAFPCFDEPSFKARFTIRVVAPDDSYKVIANMPEINKFRIENGVVYDFATSIKMSTYLVSFGLTKYSYYEDVLEDGDRKIPIRMYTYNATRENNEYAMNCTMRALKFYMEYTNISYPLSKLDMIEYRRAESAATENWGLITFREGLLSTNLGIYDRMQKKIVIYHEVSHFWFGNLVTNNWWNDIWLQEGFATYMSYRLYVNDLQMEQNLVSSYIDGFFEIDNPVPTKPLVDYLKTHDSIQKRFDTTVYNKGAAILLMLESIIGEEAFQKVVQRFLKTHAYGTVTTNDFITAIEDVVPEMNLRDFIESYVYQNRFPLIHVESGNGTFILKQQVCATTAKHTDFGQKWTVPITYITDKNKDPKFVWFDKDMDSLTIAEPDAEWIILNPQGTGHYKVSLAANQWKTITQRFQDLTPAERTTLISDAVYSFRFGLASCSVVINMMKQVNNPKQWASFLEFHVILNERMRCDENNEKALKAYIKFLNRRFSETGYSKTSKIKSQDCSKEEVESENERVNILSCANWFNENLT